MKAQDCMCNKTVCTKPETNIYEVAKLMGDNHIGCVPVCQNDGKIVGIVTDRDIILRCIACDKDVKSTPVSDIMTTKVIRTSPDTEINTVADIMNQNQIRRVPVVIDEKVVGILTLGNLAQIKDVSKDNLCETVQGICQCPGEHEA